MTDGAQILYLILCMVLVASALIARRLPYGEITKMALAWIAIFGVLALLAPFILPYLT